MKQNDSKNRTEFVFMKIYMTDKGQETGNYLLYRHEVIHGFLCALNHSENELEQVEKIEHFLDRTTVKSLELLTVQLTEK